MTAARILKPSGGSIFDEDKLRALRGCYAQGGLKAGPPRKPLEESVYYERWRG